MDKAQILVGDGDSAVRGIVCLICVDNGWTVSEAKDGVSAIKLLRRNRYSLLVLESELPVISGFMVLDTIKPVERAPTIFISRSDSEESRLAAFEAGGNDFLMKPFFPRELEARMKNLLRLTGSDWQREAVQAGGISIDVQSRAVTVDERQVHLLPREFALLLFLCRNQNQVFTRGQLLDHVWGSQYEGIDRTVDTHVKSLREKLRPYHKYIVTVWGAGYKMTI